MCNPVGSAITDRRHPERRPLWSGDHSGAETTLERRPHARERLSPRSHALPLAPTRSAYRTAYRQGESSASSCRMTIWQAREEGANRRLLAVPSAVFGSIWPYAALGGDDLDDARLFRQVWTKWIGITRCVNERRELMTRCVIKINDIFATSRCIYKAISLMALS